MQIRNCFAEQKLPLHIKEKIRRALSCTLPPGRLRQFRSFNRRIQSLETRPRRGPLTSWRWLLRQPPASACPSASCDGFDCAILAWLDAPRSWPSGKRYRPKRRWQCPACRSDPATAPRHGGRRPSRSMCRSGQGRGRCRYGSRSQRRGSRYRRALLHPRRAWLGELDRPARVAALLA